MSTLLVDYGNSRLKWRLLDDSVDDAEGVLEHDGLDGADRARMTLHDAWRELGEPSALIYASVTSEAASSALENAAGALFPGVLIKRVRSAVELGGIRNQYLNPESLGVDRLLAMVAARALVKEGALLVVGVGTATTVDLVDQSNAFVGGNILPGPAMMTRALYHGTAGLPMVELAEGLSADFGLDTTSAISAGVINAQAGAIERLYARARSGAGPLTCVLGGGAGRAIAPYLSFQAELADNLVLDGLAVIAGLN